MSGELLLPYGLAPNGRLVRVEVVPKGLACDLVCPGCRKPLIARKGEARRHHLAHAADAECGGGALESTAHRLAKQIVADNHGLHLPAMIAEVEYCREVLQPAGLEEFDIAEIEAALGAYRCDVMLSRHGQRVAVEVTVTHPCTPEKLDAFRAAGLDAVELDLRGVRWDDLGPAFGKFVLRDAPRRWLHAAQIEKAQAAMAAFVARKRAEEAAKAELVAEQIRQAEARRVAALTAERRAAEERAARLRQMRQALIDEYLKANGESWQRELRRQAELYADRRIAERRAEMEAADRRKAEWESGAAERRWGPVYNAIMDDRSEAEWMLKDRQGMGWRVKLTDAARDWLGATAADAWLKTAPSGMSHSVRSQPAWPTRDTVRAFWVRLDMARPRYGRQVAA